MDTAKDNQNSNLIGYLIIIALQKKADFSVHSLSTPVRWATLEQRAAVFCLPSPYTPLAQPCRQILKLFVYSSGSQPESPGEIL